MWDSANQGEERASKGELWFLLEFCDKGCLQVGAGLTRSLMLCTAYACSLRSVSRHAGCNSRRSMHLPCIWVPGVWRKGWPAVRHQRICLTTSTGVLCIEAHAYS